MAPKAIDPVLLGALLGWTRFPAGAGAVVRVAVTKALDRSAPGAVAEYDLALSPLQLRALGEDLIRAADEREGRVPRPKRRWWQL